MNTSIGHVLLFCKHIGYYIYACEVSITIAVVSKPTLINMFINYNKEIYQISLNSTFMFMKVNLNQTSFALKEFNCF